MNINVNTPVEVVKDLILQPQVYPWPDKGWFNWLNVQEAYRQLLKAWTPTTKDIGQPTGTGRGIVTGGGGAKHFACLWVMLARLREMGCKLPVEVWHLGEIELDPPMKELLKEFDVEVINALRMPYPVRTLRGWELKPYAVRHSKFSEVLFIDADCIPTRDPVEIFDWPEYKNTGCVVWPDFCNWTWPDAKWLLIDVPRPPGSLPPVDTAHIAATFSKPIPKGYDAPIESGAFAIDKTRHWEALALTAWLCDYSEYWFNHFHGDKDMMAIAWKRLKDKYSMPQQWPGWDTHTYLQYDFHGKVLFHHRTQDKAWKTRSNKLTEELRYFKLHERLCTLWNGAIWGEVVVNQTLPPGPSR